MIKGILFDLDDTLYDYKGLELSARKAVEEYAEKVLKIEQKKFNEAFREGREAIKLQLPFVAAGHNRLLYYQRTLEILKYNAITLALELEEIYWNYMLEYMTLNEGAEELLGFARGKGWRIGICTDLTAQIQLKKIRKLGLEKWIDCLVTSEEAGIEKPNVKMFQLSLGKMGLESREVLFIGDSYSRDIEGARSIGMKTVWYVPAMEKISQKESSRIDNFKRLTEELENGFI